MQEKEQISLPKGICLKDSMHKKDLKAFRTVPKKIFNFYKSLHFLPRKLSSGKWQRHSTDAFKLQLTKEQGDPPSTSYRWSKCGFTQEKFA